MATTDSKRFQSLAINRKARRDYAVVDRFEAGIALSGTEVKALRDGQANLTGAYARVEDRQLWLHGFTIPPYSHGNQFNHEPARSRRLLLHRKEINRLEADTEQKGLTLVPLSVYLKNGRVKIELGLCKGKTHGDKRETLKQKTAERDANRAMAQRD